MSKLLEKYKLNKIKNYKNLNISFIKYLIESDFFLDSSKLNTKNISSLDFIELTRSLKLLIRMLQTVNTRYSKNVSNFYFLVDNQDFIEILNQYLGSLFNEKNNFFFKTESFWSKDFNSKMKGHHFMLLLNNPLDISQKSYKNNVEEEKLIKRYFDNKAFLITKFNSNFEKKTWGNYKIYNEISDFKKLLFLISIFKKIKK